jgi:hypothetical protein
MARSTTKGTGSSCKRPLDLKIIRATPAIAIPTSAHTIHEGKYDPRMLLEGEPSQPVKPVSMARARQSDRGFSLCGREFTLARGIIEYPDYA